VKLARFDDGRGPRLGAVEGDEVADLTAADPAFGDDPVPLLEAAAEGIAAAERTARRAPRLPLTLVHLLPPVPRPPKFLAIGFNYRGHDADQDRPPPEFPLFFNKQTTSIIGPHDPIQAPATSDQLDYEGELVLVVGRRCRNVPAERAAEVVGGWLVGNDVSARDWQRRSPTVTLGKSFDGTAPIGPWLTTADDVPDPHDLRIRTWVNGALAQDGTTADMLTDCWAQIALLSSVCTLEAGDLISTGTPPGAAQQQSDPRWLQVGDELRVEVEGLGGLRNTVEAASVETFVASPTAWPGTRSA
jgi:2-keto-4-pentenoate hydratase/2-oxohepta-3-ene-1,7-dioic acid hydratase in catechol pathway